MLFLSSDLEIFAVSVNKLIGYGVDIVLQIIHTEAYIGKSKVESAAATCRS